MSFLVEADKLIYGGEKGTEYREIDGEGNTLARGWLEVNVHGLVVFTPDPTEQAAKVKAEELESEKHAEEMTKG